MPRAVPELRPDVPEDAGFTLLEVLAAVAVAGITLSAVAALVAVTMTGLRSTGDRVALAAAARTLLDSMPTGEGLRPGTTAGTLGTTRWRIDVVPADGAPRDRVAAASLPPAAWSPATITVSLRSRTGRSLKIETIGLMAPPSSPGGGP